MPDHKRVSILFICMGNICRSPLAENVFRAKANQRGIMHCFEVDSAGTGGWHAGEPPDHRMIETARQHGITMIGRARQLTCDDFNHFDLLLCADHDNRDKLLTMGAPPEKTRLLLEYHPEPDLMEVPDPYYGGQDGFDQVFELVEAACEQLLDDLRSE